MEQMLLSVVPSGGVGNRLLDVAPNRSFIVPNRPVF
jgi:hypothetical protein